MLKKYMFMKNLLKTPIITQKTNYDKIVIIAPGSGPDTRNSHYILTEELLEKVLPFTGMTIEA